MRPATNPAATSVAPLFARVGYARRSSFNAVRPLAAGISSLAAPPASPSVPRPGTWPLAVRLSGSWQSRTLWLLAPRSCARRRRARRRSSRAVCSVRSSRGGKAVPNRLLLLMFLLCVHFCAFRPRRGALSLLYKHCGSYNTLCLLLHESLTIRSTIIITDPPVLPAVCASIDSESLCRDRSPTFIPGMASPRVSESTGSQYQTQLSSPRECSTCSRNSERK